MNTFNEEYRMPLIVIIKAPENGDRISLKKSILGIGQWALLRQYYSMYEYAFLVY